MIGHIRDKRGKNGISEADADRFDELIKLLARQDFPRAKDLLIEMKKKGKYRTLAKDLLENAEANKDNMSTWTSYMYGSAASRKRQAYTQEYATKHVRKIETINAEKEYAKKELKMTLADREEEFHIEQ
jgi:uncharacterized membrane protein YgaE (UPF0421/DUF939 family)